jgi:hypothetical protein
VIEDGRSLVGMSELGVVELAKWNDHVQCDVIVTHSITNSNINIKRRLSHVIRCGACIQVFPVLHGTCFNVK